MRRVFSLRSAFLSIVLVGMFLLALLIGGMSVFEIDRFVKSSAKELVTEKSARESAQINEIFAGMEKSVRIMESFILDCINGGEDIHLAEAQEEIVAQASKMFADVAKNTDGTVAYYFRFAPEFSDNAGFFYSKGKGENVFVAFEPTDISAYPKDDREHVGWYWEPYEAGTAIWMVPYYNRNNDITMISFVIPIDAQNEFVGVVGMDFDYNTLLDKVNSIKVYENGYAHLEKNGEVLYLAAEHASAAGLKPHPDDFQIVGRLRNGMDLVVTADHHDIYRIRRQVMLQLIITTVVVTMLLACIATLFVHRIVRPIKTLTEAAEKLAKNDYHINICHSSAKEIIQLNATFQHMTEQLREREKLQQMLAYRDALTGLRNTTSYKAWISEFDKQRQEDAPAFGVVVLDINFLKETNDRYGHDAGNQLIVRAARLISDTFKRSPVFRIGGDEFVVILQNRDFHDREELIQKFYRDCNEEMLQAGDRRIPVSVASGSAVYDPGIDTGYQDVFNRADDAMYKHKREMKGGAGR
jgi:diguanylate cyclase (GGDEF)-like protein